MSQRSRYLRRQSIRTPRKCQDPEDHKTPTQLPEIIRTTDKYPQPVDIKPSASYSIHIHIRSTLMSVAYQQARKQKVRITLELNVFEDFNARDIDFEKLFKLEPSESVDVYVEEFDRY